MAIVKVKTGKGSLSDIFNYVLDKEKTEEKSADWLNAGKEKAKALFGKQSEKKAEEPQETKQEDATEKSQDEEKNS